jgi:epoxyqueuosine reductase QueG
MVCTNACPGKAISGKLWKADLDRDEFFDPLACRKKARELAAEKIRKEITLCGKCIEVCPYTQSYLRSQK